MLPGENAPPMHPWCRCSTAAYMDGKEYEEWLDFLDKGGTTEEWERLKSQKKSGTIKEKMKMNLQFFAKIPDEKFTKYALDFENAPDKAKAFKEALGYTKDNYQDLIKNIEKNLDESKLVIKGNNGYGDLYEYVMQLYGPNGKTANVLTAWIREKDDIRLTSAYVTKKKVTE